MQEVQGEEVKFRTGDRVRFTGMSTARLKQGEEYTVRSWFEAGGKWFVALDTVGGCVSPDKLVLVEKPEVHSGGPYVCTSVYENMVNQRDVAIEAVAVHQKEIKSLRGDVSILTSLLDQVKKERDKLAADAKQWQDLTAEINKLQDQLAAKKDPASLKKPDPPPWLRPGWWYAMDSDGDWYAYQTKPKVNEEELEWAQGTINMRISSWRMDGHNIPKDRWREACWQVPE